MAMKVRYTVIDGEVVSESRGGVERDYISDVLGNTIALVDNTGAKTDTFEYFPSGTVSARTGTTATPFQWNGGSGYYRDSSSRSYVRARHLSTSQGRWQSQDPIGFDAGDYNLYRYVGNRFVVATDPSGLDGVGGCWAKEYMASVRGGSDLTSACRLANAYCGTQIPCNGALPPVPPAPVKSPPDNGPGNKPCPKGGGDNGFPWWPGLLGGGLLGGAGIEIPPGLIATGAAGLLDLLQRMSRSPNRPDAPGQKKGEGPKRSKDKTNCSPEVEGQLQWIVKMACDNTTCSGVTSCPSLIFQAGKSFACLLARKHLKAMCFPGATSHDEALQGAERGYMKCLGKLKSQKCLELQ